MLDNLFSSSAAYMQGEEYRVEIDNVVKLDVEVVAFNKDRTTQIRKECNYKESVNSIPTVLNQLMKELKKSDLNTTRITQNKLIHIAIHNTNITDKYLNGVCNKNIINTNQKASEKRILKENIRNAREEIEQQTQAKLDDEAINKIAEIIMKKMKEQF